MPHDLLIVCAYTAGSPYELEARQLAASAERFGYPVRAIAVADQGDWWRNVGIKPTYVLEALLSHSGPLLFLDADCLILQPLDEMLALLERGDVAVKYRPGNCLSALFNAAVLLLKKTPATLELVETWAERGRQFAQLHRFSEQGAFAEGVVNAQPDLRLVPLPERFHMFPLKPSGGPPPGCVILHNKTSNRVRATALPAAPPVVAGLPADVHVVSLGPQAPAAVAGMPMAGIHAANQDFTEYASRYGITKLWFFGAPIAEQDRAGLEAYKIAALKNLFERLPLGARVILANYDVVFLRDPSPMIEALERSDLALVWDRRSPVALPRTEVIGLKITAALRSRLLPVVEQAQRDLLAATQQPAAGHVLGRILRAAAAEVSIAELPAGTIAELSDAGRQTIALSLRGEISSIQGEPRCMNLPIPSPIDQPSPLSL